ncbi:FMN-linked oxidoreductase [Flagelloscypha sp. PMI_526]|nr:FMN-linked oxidoreductase [Flagelloscypha sp. PMI_526]
MASPVNEPAPNLPYFTPFQKVPSGQANDLASAPTLFQPFKIRGLEFQNRIWVSPMCQYSADDGHLTDWHIAHLGGILSRGPSLTFIEGTGVLPEGRITPQCPGLWKDSQIAPIKRLVDFAHSQNQKVGIQLAHAGRKASTNALWLSGISLATKEVGGWPDDVVAPSTLPFAPGFAEPKALTKEGIERIKQAFVDAAKRAVKAGIDVVEVHVGHGYLGTNFLSPTSNHRTDEYGGSFENRIRLPLELVDAVRAVIPDTMPLFLRISGTEGLEHLPDVESWKSEDTVAFAKLLESRGVDVMDISSGGNDPRQRGGPIQEGLGYQVPLSEAVKKALGPNSKMLVSAVGSIRSGTQAQQILDEGRADVIFVGRQFLKDPGLVWTFADDLGVNINTANQIRWAFTGRGTKTAPKPVEGGGGSTGSSASAKLTSA